MIKEVCCSYEVAKLLKEKGFPQEYDIYHSMVYNEKDYEDEYEVQRMVTETRFVKAGTLSSYPIGVPPTEDAYHLWTIQDAKDGDVLAYDDGSLAIFRYRLSGLDSGLYMSHVVWTDEIEIKQTCAINNVHPATKEQRDLLFQKIKEAGYIWNNEKKELKKIEFNDIIEENYQQQADDLINMVTEKSAWSEEDERMLNDTIGAVFAADYYTYDDKREIESWLKSLKDRYTWKPSKEQIKALQDINITGNISYAGQGQTLIELYNDLKRLKQ